MAKKTPEPTAHELVEGLTKYTLGDILNAVADILFPDDEEDNEATDGEVAEGDGDAEELTEEGDTEEAPESDAAEEDEGDEEDEEEEEEGGTEEAAEEEDEGDEEDDEGDRQFPDQSDINGMTEEQAAATVLNNLKVDLSEHKTIASPKNFLIVVAALFEGDDQEDVEVELNRDNIKKVAKTFGQRILKSDTVESLTEKVVEYINVDLGFGDDDGEEGDDPAVAEAKETGAGIAEQLAAVQEMTGGAKKSAAKKAAKKASKKAAKK